MNSPSSHGSSLPGPWRPGVLLGGVLAASLSLLRATTFYTGRIDPAAVASGPAPSAPVLTATSASDAATLKVRVRQLPLYFIENQGQSAAQVGYYLQEGQTSAYFTAQGLTLALQAPAPAAQDGNQPELLKRLAQHEPAAPHAPQRWAVKVQFVDSAPVRPQGRAKTAAVVSYFKGPQSDWKTGLPTYQEVVYPSVWPGIDVVYSGDGGQIKTTFHVQPGADPGRIALTYQGATDVRLTEAGRLAVQTPVGGFEEERPVVYQEIAVRRVAVEACYTLAQAGDGEWRAGSALSEYDPAHPQVSASFQRSIAGCPEDQDCDGIPDGIEIDQGTDPAVKDNDLFNNPRLFAMQQYRDLLGREAEPAGVEYWDQVIANGTYTRAQVVELFFTAPEFSNWIAPIVRLYFAALGRALGRRVAPYDGVRYWSELYRRYRSGAVLEGIAQHFATSPDFLSTYGTLSNEEFAQRMYLDVLGREPEPGAKEWWTGQLDSVQMSRGQVLLGFSDSAEHQQRTAQAVIVVMLYSGLLRRAPERGAVEHWVGYLNGHGLLALIQSFLDAAEYHNRLLPED